MEAVKAFNAEVSNTPRSLRLYAHVLEVTVVGAALPLYVACIQLCSFCLVSHFESREKIARTFAIKEKK